MKSLASLEQNIHNMTSGAKLPVNICMKQAQVQSFCQKSSPVMQSFTAV